MQAVALAAMIGMTVGYQVTKEDMEALQSSQEVFLCIELLTQTDEVFTCSIEFDQMTPSFQKLNLPFLYNEVIEAECYRCAQLIRCSELKNQQSLLHYEQICFTVSGISLMLVGLYMLSSKKLNKMHPYPFIAWTCLVGGLYYLH